MDGAGAILLVAMRGRAVVQNEKRKGREYGINLMECDSEPVFDSQKSSSGANVESENAMHELESESQSNCDIFSHRNDSDSEHPSCGASVESENTIRNSGSESHSGSDIFSHQNNSDS